MPMNKVMLYRDPKDDMLLECCLAARARFLVSGDKDLLTLKKVPFNLKIVSPREFLESNL
jgi:predicted nucleic acid-binding protein